jgi:hypothetical protein
MWTRCSASFGPNSRSFHRSGLQNKELDSAIGVRSPRSRFRTGEKGYFEIFVHICITFQYNTVFMGFMDDHAKRDACLFFVSVPASISTASISDYKSTVHPSHRPIIAYYQH